MVGSLLPGHMWTFPGLFFVFFLSSLSAAWAVRSLAPWFWAHAVPQTHVIIRATSVVKIDNQLYGAFLVLFTIFFGINLMVWSRLTGRYRWVKSAVRVAAFCFASYLVTVSGKNLFTLDLLSVKSVIASLVIGTFLAGVTFDSSAVISALVGLAALRMGIKPLVLYDVSAHEFLLLFDYIPIAIGIAVIVYVNAVLMYPRMSRRIVQMLAQRFSRTRITLLLIALFWLSLAFLMTTPHGGVDIYYVLLPAYHLLHGGVPFVWWMSQYGFLYVAPWVFWLLLFPHAPISYLTGTVYSTILLSMYYCGLALVGARLYKNRVILVLTMLAGFYFTMLIRYYNFPDPVPLVASPAFTPLRFGMFILPMACLLSYTRGGGRKYFSYFLAVSGFLFFYSFEIGTSIVAAAIAIAFLDAVGHKHRVVATGAKNMMTLLGSLFLVGVLISGLIAGFSGRVPDWGLYAFSSRLYGLGFLALPLNGQTTLFAPIGIGVFGLIFGVWLFVAKKRKHGLIFVYLGLMTLALMPYYMNRSIPPTLYNVSLPFLLLCGLLLQWCADFRKEGIRHMAIWMLAGLSGFLLLMGAVRAGLILGHTVLHTAEVVDKAGHTVQKSFGTWDIKNSASYLFLKTHLPHNCPLIAFDAQEYELLTATGAAPAYEYAFVWGFIVNREQVNQLHPYPGAMRVCIFVNDAYIDTRDDVEYGVYEYYWAKYGRRARLIASDPMHRLRLFSLAVQ